MPTPPPGYVYQPVRQKAPTLPVVPTPYHAFWRAPGLAWWRPLVGLLVAVAITVVGLIVSVMVWIVLDLSLGIDPFTDDLMAGQLGDATPGLFLSNNVILAALIPAVMIAGLIVGQKIGYLHSVQGRMRWGWMGTCLLIAVVPLGLVIGGTYLFSWSELGLQQRPETWMLLVGILLTTPLQAAGEEYAMRGLLPRVFGAWISHRGVSLVVGVLVSSVIFMLVHGAADPWLNLLYFSIAVIFSYLTWRTGGLEAAIALHIVNNLLSLLPVPWMGLEGIFDRSAGVAGPEVLFNLAAMIAAAAVIDRMARRRGLPRETAPGTPQPAIPAQHAGTA